MMYLIKGINQLGDEYSFYRMYQEKIHNEITHGRKHLDELFTEMKNDNYFLTPNTIDNWLKSGYEIILQKETITVQCIKEFIPEEFI